MINRRLQDVKREKQPHNLTMEQMGNAVNALFGKSETKIDIKQIIEKGKNENRIKKN